MNRRQDRLIRLGAACFIGGLLASFGAGAQPEPEPRAKALRIVSRTALPKAQSVATDIRWASEDSVYVSWYHDGGVAEVGLDGVRRRGLIPNARTFGSMEQFYGLAVSPAVIAAAPSAWHVYWRPRASEKGTFKLHRLDAFITHDLDLWGDRLVLLGYPKGGPPYAEGAVAWLAALGDETLEDLRPVLYDAGWMGFPEEHKLGGGAPSLYLCQSKILGAVRFLDDGSFVVAPGFQKGVHLFNAKGERVRSWSSEQLGLDSDCSGFTGEEERKVRTDTAYWLGWLNGHRVVDDVLPLPQGPGLLVRAAGEDGQVRWTLKVLAPEGVETYTVPLASRRREDRLHGDVRGGRIVLLLSATATAYNRDPENRPGEIVVAEMPR